MEVKQDCFCALAWKNTKDKKEIKVLHWDRKDVKENLVCPTDNALRSLSWDLLTAFPMKRIRSLHSDPSAKWPASFWQEFDIFLTYLSHCQINLWRAGGCERTLHINGWSGTTQHGATILDREGRRSLTWPNGACCRLIKQHNNLRITSFWHYHHLHHTLKVATVKSPFGSGYIWSMCASP